MGRTKRLPGYDYSTNGCYFITFCTKDRRNLLAQIVGRDDLGAPQVKLYPAGICLERYIRSIPEAYQNVTVDKYVIMPNHVHLLISIWEDGAPGSSRPAKEAALPGEICPRATQLIPRMISVLKKYVSRNQRENIWQSTYHDRIIRSEREYLKIWSYIDTNPARWADDCYYKEHGT